MAQWKESWIDCCGNCGICCVTCMCPCIQYGLNAEKLDGSSCVTNALLLMFCGWLPCFVQGPRRKLLRQRYGLQEDCPDFLIHCLCPLCAICQEAREMQNRGPPPNQTMGY